ncbi:hypothetical protein, partial [Luedemannella helvata]|uniref:hypothetical protein n=1 Tax=Luedemannella helvata TaxID=349315 RepID=UPI0031D199C1
SPRAPTPPKNPGLFSGLLERPSLGAEPPVEGLAARGVDPVEAGELFVDRVERAMQADQFLALALVAASRTRDGVALDQQVKPQRVGHVDQSRHRGPSFGWRGWLPVGQSDA